MTKIKLITTIDKNGYMTEGNKLLYSLSGNLSSFKSHTIAKSLIFGRKSFEQLEELFPYRQHHVLSTTLEVDDKESEKNVFFYSSIKEMMDSLNALEIKEAFVLGGPETINNFIKYNLFDELIITHIDQDLKSDIKLNLEYLDLHSWNIYNRTEYKKSATNAYDFTVINYIKPKKRFY